MKNKIGILGEHPQNDAYAIKRLIEKSELENLEKFHIKIALKNIRGSDFEKNGKPSKKAILLLKQEFKSHKFKFVIYLKDLDGLPSDEKLIIKRKEWFDSFDEKAGNGEGLFFLAIYEMESIILADIDTFNKMYDTKINFKRNPMYQSNPKEYLKKSTFKNKKKQYSEADCPKLFEKLNFETVIKNHKGEWSFAEFMEKFEEKINRIQ